MTPKNDIYRDYLGITAWHRAGYTGKRGLTASGEDFLADKPSLHALNTLEVFHEVAPDRQVIYTRIKQAPYTEGIDTMFVSLSSSTGAADRTRMDEDMPDRLTLFVSAGNKGDEKYNKYMVPKKVYGVGAVRLLDTTTGPTLQTAPYTSVSKHVDFAGITDWRLASGRTFGGTSCACPVVAGMAALINDKAIADFGRPLTHEAMYRLLKDISIDTDTEGRDDHTGWGLPILPPPDKLDLRRYADMTYKDDAAIAEYHKSDVYRAQELGLMMGDDKGNFNPLANLTRQEAASVLVRLYDSLTERS